jgi:hypothetical protein
MRIKLLLAAVVLLALTSGAYAGYDTETKNILNDVTTIVPSGVAANDYVKVYAVSNTTSGYGTAEKIRLSALSGYVADLIATNTLTTADCGKTLLLNASTEFATTLPAPSSGCKLRFVVKAAPSGASYTVLTASGDNVMIGGINELEVDTGDDGPCSTGADTLTFVDGVAAVGDFVEMISDGTSWYINGQTNHDGGVTLAAT